MNDLDAIVECTDELSEQKSLLQHPGQKRGYWNFPLALAHGCTTAVLFITTVVSLLMLMRRTRACDARNGSYDPFVPQNILQDPKVLNYGYYVGEPLPADTFKNISIMEQRLTEIGLFHMSTAVKVNGDYKVWIDEDGVEKKLFPKITINGDEVYLVSSFHTMHCLMATIRDYGYLINGYKPKWSDAHTLHCLNKFYNTIACLADSVVEGYKDPQDPSGVPTGEIRRASEMTVTATLLLREEKCSRYASSETSSQPFVPTRAYIADEEVNYPYYAQDIVKLDIFTNISILEQRIEELGLLHISTAVKTNGRSTTWTDEHGIQQKLHPIVTQDGDEVYVVAALHQMHCLMLTIREFGYLLNGYRPMWSDAHIAHCFNLFFEAITCLADSRVEGISKAAPSRGLPPNEIQKVSETPFQPKCSSFGALHDWAQEPLRALPYKPLSGHKDVKEVLPKACSPANCRDEHGWIGDDRDGST
ncbi:hypothetical protein EKO04_003964 [Ascochyta lentis]|uniref:Uncharacterized protein n=1 Tax=Ascochyta lentis TaxID=205686 RepID=A0A8H7J7F9_9PLEO|nr:hypothetical protein EKO04_003964 [Ascochyta lentis]